MNRIWRIIRIPFYIILALYIGLVIYRIPVAQERLKTQEVVKKIQAQRITLADVMSQNLPPAPDSTLNNSTVEGIDANNNGIRDDVELAIFKLHPGSAKIRAAELQYAMALQNEFVNVFNSETLVAVIRQEGRASVCILDSKITNDLEDLVFNTSIRKNFRNDLFKKFMTSFALPNSNYCDIDPKSLTN